MTILRGTALLLVASLAAGCIGPPPLKHEPAPAFYLTDTNGEPQNLQQYNGTVLVLDLFATWCLPCREQMQALKAVQVAHPETLRVLAIATDPTETKAELEAFEQKYGSDWPIVQDNLTLGPALGIHYLPGVAIITRDQVLVFTHEGTPVDAKRFEEVLARLGSG